MNLWQYFWPEGISIVEATIVSALLGLFMAWLLGLVAAFVSLRKKHSALDRCRDVAVLAEALGVPPKEMSLEASDEAFDAFCTHTEVKKDSPEARHVRAIFDAGYRESRLEVDSLIRHTAAKFFRNNGFLRSILALFIVIGLLGTLFGLAESLVELSIPSNTGGEAQAQLRQNLNELLTGLRGAFAPSLTGVLLTIIGVILYSLFLWGVGTPLQQRLERYTLTLWVPRLYPTLPERLLIRSQGQLQRSIAAAEEVVRFAEDIDEQISTLKPKLDGANEALGSVTDSTSAIHAFSDRLSRKVEALHGFQKTLHQLYEQTVLNSQKMADNAQVFQASMMQSAQRVEQLHQENKTILEAQGQQLAEKLDTQNTQFTGALQTQNTQLAAALDTLGTRLAARLDTLNTQLTAKLDTQGTRLTDSLDTQSIQLAESLGTLGTQLTAKLDMQGTQLADALDTQSTRLTDSLDKQRDQLAERLQTQADQLADALDTQSKLLNQSMDEQGQQVAAMLGALKLYEETYVAGRERIEHGLDKVLEAATATLNSIKARNQELIAAVGDPLVEKLDEQLRAVSTELSSVSNTLDVHLADIRQKWNEMKDPLREAADRMEIIGETVSKRLEVIIPDVARTFRDQNEQYDERFHRHIRISTENTGILAEMSQQLGRLLERVVVITEAQDREVQQLSVKIDGLSRNLTTLPSLPQSPPAPSPRHLDRVRDRYGESGIFRTTRPVRLVKPPSRWERFLDWSKRRFARKKKAVKKRPEVVEEVLPVPESASDGQPADPEQTLSQSTEVTSEPVTTPEADPPESLKAESDPLSQQASSEDPPPDQPSEDVPKPEEAANHPTGPEQALAAMTGLYNQAMHHGEDSLAFEERYQPLRLDVSNGLERKENPDLEPVFEQNPDGDCLAVPVPESGSGKYAVFPQVHLTITPRLFVDSAMDILFETADPPAPESSYNRFEVKKPAIFRQDAGQQWVVIERGILDLGPAAS